MASKDALKAQAQGSAPQIRIAGLIWLISAMIVMAAAGTWLALAVMTGDYLGNGKAVRDAAEAGSGLLSQQGSIEAVKDWVLPLAFLGVAGFLLGFGFAFSSILRFVRLRGNTMAELLPVLKQRSTTA